MSKLLLPLLLLSAASVCAQAPADQDTAAMPAQEAHHPTLHAAVAEGDVEAVLHLIESGADVNAPSMPNTLAPDGLGFGETPLMRAAAEGNSTICRILLAAGADPDGTTLYECNTALQLAALGGHTEVCRVLLAAGAEVNATSRTMMTALHMAAYYGHRDTCLQLIAAGADVDAVDRWGATPLADAIFGSIDEAGRNDERGSIIQDLIDAGAEPNELNIAIESGSVEYCTQLLRAGADIHYREDDEDISPLEHALQTDHASIKQLIVNWEGAPIYRQDDNLFGMEEYLGEAQGTIIISHPAKDEYLLYGSGIAYHRKSPCSTFKIIASLLALESGALDPSDSVRAWNGTTYAIEAWNHDIDFESAFRSSCVWYFRELIDELASRWGEELGTALESLGYGNADVLRDYSGKLNTCTEDPTVMGFWLKSSLMISPVEQVEVMEHIFGEDSPYSPETLTELKRVMLVDDEEAGIRIYGKTGTGGQGPYMTDGWFVGFAETPEGNIYFCIYLERSLSGEDVSGPQAKQILLPILKQYIHGEISPQRETEETNDTATHPSI